MSSTEEIRLSCYLLAVNALPKFSSLKKTVDELAAAFAGYCGSDTLRLAALSAAVENSNNRATFDAVLNLADNIIAFARPPVVAKAAAPKKQEAPKRRSR